MEELQELSDFFARANSSAFEKKLLFAVDAIRNADLTIFVGMGSSGTLAKYGARYFANMGHFAVGLEDTLYPITTFQWKNTVVIALSESGETDRLIEAIHQFKQKQCTILSITNSSASTLAKMSDWNFSYHLSTKRINGDITELHRFRLFSSLKLWQREYKKQAVTCFVTAFFLF